MIKHTCNTSYYFYEVKDSIVSHCKISLLPENWSQVMPHHRTSYIICKHAFVGSLCYIESRSQIIQEANMIYEIHSLPVGQVNRWFRVNNQQS